MRAKLANFVSGASALSLELSSSEIDSLIGALKVLRENPDSHFHFRSYFEEDGVGDIEFSCSGSTEHGNLRLEA